MDNQKAYSGLDSFRMIAALLVIAIHTSPLTSVSAASDFILTRILARVAVPFFFMTSGFFLSAGGEGIISSGRLAVFVKKTALIYAAAVLFYLPLNLYHGLPPEWTNLSGILRDLCIDGTFYHLWYLPASIVGAAVSWALVRAFKIKGALVFAVLLYAAGLLGDSYYGFIKDVPVLGECYQTLFSVSAYSRNGLFFAPVFMLMGALTANRPNTDTKACVIGLFISLALLLVEGLALKDMDGRRHDSMYVMLVPCMLFLFRSLLHWKSKSTPALRQYSLVVYLVHPWVIALLLKASALMQMPWLFENSVMRLLLVAAGSMAAALLWGMLIGGIKRRKGLAQGLKDRAWAEINLSNLTHNVRALQSALGQSTKIMAVVKADAYGHGDIAAAKTLSREGIDAFAVATIDEGIRLRKSGIKGEILILGYTDMVRTAELRRYDLAQTVVDAPHAQALNRFGKQVKVHIKVDTGMHRLGSGYHQVDEVNQIFACEHLQIDGIYTHLCAADSLKAEDEAFTRLQIRRFYELLETLKAQGIALPKSHIQSSYGVLNHPEVRCDLARIGLALYGAMGSTKQRIDLKPVLSLKARVVHVSRVAAGESVGYGREFTAQRDTVVATIAIGYADGIPRSLSGQGDVLLRGCRAPIIGRICMDQLMADVTDVVDVQRGDIVTLIGSDGDDEINAVDVAQSAGTIPNELLSRLGSRLQRICYGVSRLR